MGDGSGLTGVQRSTLHRVSSVLRKTEVVWVLTGSAAFAIRGLDTFVHDLDIQTDALGAYAIQRLLAPYMVSPVRHRTASTIRSHLGRAVIGGVPVEIMGAIEKRRSDGTWDTPADFCSLIEWVTWDREVWPVLPLAYEVAQYRAMGRVARADDLEKWMRDYGEGTRRDYDER